jgi:hypothetical protein
MSESYSGPADSDFQVGRVINRSFELLFSDFVKFFATTVIIWLPFLALSFFGGAYIAASINWGVVLVGAVLAVVLILGLSIFSQAVVLYGAFQKMRGLDFSIGASFAQGFSRSLPILGMLLLMGLAIFFGLLLLVVPALILSTMWFVALPACVIERLGPMASLDRSAVLTRGYRWKVFGIYILILVVNEIVAQVLNAILGEGITGAIVNLLWLALASAYQSIVVAVIYHDLRAAKEGIGVERIAQVFD